LLPKHIQRAAREIERAARILPGTSRSATVSDNDLRRAIFAGYPDCLCKRRAANSRRFLMCSGHGATLAAESSVHEGEFLVALDMQTLERNSGTESLIRLACLVDREWIESTGKRIDHRFDTDSGQVKAVEVELYGQIPMHQRHVPPDPEIAAALLTEAILRRGLDENEQQLARRLRFAGIAIEIPALVQSACCGASQISDVRIASQLPLEWLQTINRLAPQKLHLPSGRWVRLDYSEDGSVSASVKLQELFGLAETPRIGLRNEPILMILLAPNGRAVQQTRDLRSFWERGYPQVRKELRGRYPRHPWPEDPWSATPTSRAQPRRRKL
jgi:ATP-dependent helicase HrpB